MLENWLSCNWHWGHSIALFQLIVTLMHYPCTVPLLPGLANWSAFLEWGLPTLKSQLRQWVNGLEINLSVTDHETSLRPQGLLGSIADASWIHSYSKQCLNGCFATSHPTRVTLPPPTSYASTCPVAKLAWNHTVPLLKIIKKYLKSYVTAVRLTISMLKSS